MDHIPYIIGAVLALIGAGWFWLRSAMSRRPKPQDPSPPAPSNPEPEKTTAEHETAIVLEEADIIDAVAADHDADPNKVGELMDLADATRKE